MGRTSALEETQTACEQARFALTLAEQAAEKHVAVAQGLQQDTLAAEAALRVSCARRKEGRERLTAMEGDIEAAQVSVSRVGIGL